MHGYRHLIENATSPTNPKHHKSEPTPLNKVGLYNEGEDGNTTLKAEFNDCEHIAILDSIVGIAVATKSTWETWGKLGSGI